MLLPLHPLTPLPFLPSSPLPVPLSTSPLTNPPLSPCLCGGLQLGANAILAVSLAVCKAGAGALKIPLYRASDIILMEYPSFTCGTK